MPTFNTIERRLIMRYSTGSAFSFGNVRAAASDQAVQELATALASIQSQQPTRVISVVTRQLL
jgi:hypothetical protein